MSTLVFAHSRASLLERFQLSLLVASFSPFVRPASLLRALEYLENAARDGSAFDLQILPGCRVTLRNRDSGELQEWDIVLPRDSAARRGRLSCLSPLGIALLGKKVGDVITVDALGAKPGFHVVDIKKQKED